MGRVGSCYDNAVAESFFANLKAEIGTKVWATRAEARQAVFAYLTYYNRNRLHSTLKLRTHTRRASAIVNPSPSRHETPVSGPGVELQSWTSVHDTCGLARVVVIARIWRHRRRTDNARGWTREPVCWIYYSTVPPACRGAATVGSMSGEWSAAH